MSLPSSAASTPSKKRKRKKKTKMPAGRWICPLSTHAGGSRSASACPAAGRRRPSGNCLSSPLKVTDSETPPPGTRRLRPLPGTPDRSEERRVGKECGSRGEGGADKKVLE